MIDFTEQQMNARQRALIESERELAEQMRAIIERERCSIRAAAITLGMTLNQFPYRFARRHGIESYSSETRVDEVLEKRFYGQWIVEERLPRRKSDRSSAALVRCLCTGCGRRHKVQVDNLIDGLSKGCRSCRIRASKQRPVVCLNSQTRYPSMKDAAEQEKIPYSTLKSKLKNAKPGQLVELKNGKKFKLLLAS